MTLSEQVFTQALLLGGGISEDQKAVLQVLCDNTISILTRRLRDGLTPDSCMADFVAASSLYALADLSQADDENQIESFQAGDVTIRRKSGDSAVNCLRMQADLIISPYLKDRFSFVGV